MFGVIWPGCAELGSKAVGLSVGLSDGHLKQGFKVNINAQSECCE